MPDNKQVLDPGWIAQDANGNPLSGAKLRFFEAQTTTPRTVYADADLSNALPIPIVTNSAGLPTSDGNAVTLIYTGLNPFKFSLKTAGEVDVFTPQDDIPGALDTSPFGGDTRITSPVTSVSTDQVLAFADSGKLYNVNCSGGPVVFTLGAATSLQDGWRVGIRHNGALPAVATAANQVKIITTGGDLIALPNLISTTAFSIISKGQEAWIRCDGSGFSVGEVAPPLLNTTGVIVIAGRLSAPPASPSPGARYILLTTPTGVWSTFAQHDIAEADGNGGWFRYTPATDCGWIAYVQNEDIHYRFFGTAWVADIFATQADQETGTSLVVKVAPGTQKFHPSHPKAWGLIGVTGNLIVGDGISGVADTGAGEATLTWTTAFSSANYAVNVTPHADANVRFGQTQTRLAGSIHIVSCNIAGSKNDPDSYSVSAWGDLA